jgi:hypothetical protein
VVPVARNASHLISGVKPTWHVAGVTSGSIRHHRGAGSRRTTERRQSAASWDGLRRASHSRPARASQASVLIDRGAHIAYAKSVVIDGRGRAEGLNERELVALGMSR